MKHKYYIDTELGTEFQDSGPWRNYHLVTYGDTEAELLKEAWITEIDQDGGEISTYPLDEASRAIDTEVSELIKLTIKETK